MKNYAICGTDPFTLVDTANSNLFNFTDNSFTINVWANSYSSNAFIAGNGDHLTGWCLIRAGDKYYFGSANGPGTEHDVWYDTTVSVNSFHMITITRSGTDTPLMYIDGLIVPGSITDPVPTPGASSNPVRLGRGFTPDDDELDGDIWLFQVWSNALSGENISELYHHQLLGVPYP